MRRAYAGTYTNWKQVGGPDLPIRVVSRDSGSGSRRTFDAKVLKEAEGGKSSDDCRRPDSLHTRGTLVLCELGSTTDLPAQVNGTPGAVGFAESYATGTFPSVQRVQIGGRDGDIEAARAATYPFWTVEYFYTYGEPAAGSLPADFLRSLADDAAKNALGRYAHVPCPDSRSGRLCEAPAP